MATALPRPWTTYALIAANVLAFVASVGLGLSPINPDGVHLLDVGGNFGPVTLGGEPWRLVTAMFLHAGVMHLAMNMLGLHAGGQQIEIIYGRAGMIAIYLVAGLVGSLASALRATAVSVGASGAIFGLFGAFGGFLLRHRDRLDPVAVRSAGRGLLMLLAFNVLLGLSMPGIDMAAHLGGAIGGFAAGWAIERCPRRWSLTVRAAVVAVAGVAVIGGLTAVAPRPAPDLPVVVAEFFEMEAATLPRLSRIEANASAAQLADQLERDVLGPYRVARRDLEQGGLDERWSALRKVARIREDALVGMVAAARAGDVEAFAVHQRAFSDAPDALRAR